MKLPNRLLIVIALAISLLAYFQDFSEASTFDESHVPSMSTNLTGFDIPFSIDNSNGKYIEAQLYMSQDKGRSWRFYQSKPLSAKKFAFQCDSDGEYWFAMKTLDRDRKLIPGGNAVNPEMKIIVDTKKPKLEFQISPDASGRIIASWRAQDTNLDLATIQISHRDRTAINQDWTPTEFRPNKSPVGNSYVDQIAWWPKTSAQNIDVRFQIADAAGNQVEATRTTRLAKSAIPTRNFSSTTWQKRQRSDAQNCPGGVCQFPPSQPNPQIANAKSLNSKPGDWLKDVFRQSSSQTSSAPPSQPRSALAIRTLDSQITRDAAKSPDSIPWNSKTNKWVQQDQSRNASTVAENKFPIQQRDQHKDQFVLKHPYQDVPVVNRVGTPSIGRKISDQNHPKPNSNMFVTESSTMRNGKSQVPVTVKAATQENPTQHRDGSGWNNSNRSGQGSQPQDQPSNYMDPAEYVDPPAPAVHRQIVPARPISAANGHSANRMNSGKPGNIPILKANSPRFNLNYDVRAIDPSGVGKVVLWVTNDEGRIWNSLAVDPDNTSPFPVQVQTEGTFGFKVVINSRDGLAGKPPSNGDSPDVLVDVDWTRPKVQINSAPYGSGKDAGKLIIQFNATDKNLALRPIHLFYSPQPNGPWTTIDEGLRNSGSYAWKVPSQVPEQIYLRIEARDTANNFGAYQLTTPLDISGLVPRGRIYGVEPISN